MPYILKKYYPLRMIIFILGEGLLIFAIINIIFISWIGYETYQELVFMYVFKAVVFTFAFQLCFYYFDLYDHSIIPKFSEHMLQVLQALGFACIILALVYFLFPFLAISTRVFWSGIIAAGVVIVSWHFFYFKSLERHMFSHPIAVIGTGGVAGEIVAALRSRKDSGFNIVCFVGEKNPDVVPAGTPVYSEVEDLYDLCALRRIEKIVIAVDEKRGMPMQSLIRYKFMGIQVIDVVGFYEALTGKVMVERVNPSWLLFSDGFYVNVSRRGIKRIMDIVVATFMLLFSAPIFVVSALIIKLESPGEVFYCQERVGKNGKIFRIVKFRSMLKDSEKDGPVWASTTDDRVTRYGRFMRKMRIDELPQLFNVLKGEMSFVGPRPERPEFVEELAQTIPFYTIRQIVKPGITGWAQISYPYGASMEDALRKLEYDLYYIKNLSIGMDLATIFQTIKVVLFQKGAR